MYNPLTKTQRGKKSFIVPALPQWAGSFYAASRIERGKGLNTRTLPELRLSGGCSVKPMSSLLSGVTAEQFLKRKNNCLLHCVATYWSFSLGLRRSHKLLAENWRPSHPSPFLCSGSSGVEWPPCVKVGDTSHVRPSSGDWALLADTRRKDTLLVLPIYLCFFAQGSIGVPACYTSIWLACHLAVWIVCQISDIQMQIGIHWTFKKCWFCVLVRMAFW